MKGTKIFVGGIQGSGKTYFVSHNLINIFKKPVVYCNHLSDWQHLDKNVTCIVNNIPTMDDLNRVCAKVKLLAIEGECDCLVIDEADWFFPNNISALRSYSTAYDLLINHRHYKKGYPHVDNPNIEGLAIILITRRPQSLPTELTETCEYLITFAIEGDNVIEKFKRIHPDYEVLLPKLKKDLHNCIFKRVGENPELISSFEVRDVDKLKGGFIIE